MDERCCYGIDVSLTRPDIGLRLSVDTDLHVLQVIVVSGETDYTDRETVARYGGGMQACDLRFRVNGITRDPESPSVVLAAL